ncbi:MAG: hypothetical protein HGA23_07540, partial [Bacteroidales bacterium]|nr:hypothetical protein [Bacteroidales bacterium]
MESMDMKSLVFISQSVIQIFVGIGAFICGALLMLVPSGTIFQMSPEMLQQSPFNDFFIPGIILLLVNGLGQLAAGMLTIRKYRLAGYAGAVFGIG